MANQTNDPDTRKTSSIGIWLAFGTALGAALGSATGNMGMGLAVGVALGITVGAAIDWANHRAGRGKPSREPRRAASLLVAFALSMAGYVILMILSVWLVRQIDGQLLKTLVVLLPVIPVLFGLHTILRVVAGFDEFQRRVLLESLTISVTGTGIVALIVGLLENAGLVQPNWSWMVAVICLLWAAGQWVSARKYR